MTESTTPALGDEVVFGQRIRQQRVFTLHLSQREFAAAAGVDYVTLSKVEAGHVKPWDEATIRRVADVLGDDADALLALAAQWRPPDPATLESVGVYAPHPRFCIVCGRDMRDQKVYHEVPGGKAVCVEHLDDPAHYWTAERGPATAPEEGRAGG